MRAGAAALAIGHRWRSARLSALAASELGSPGTAGDLLKGAAAAAGPLRRGDVRDRRRRSRQLRAGDGRHRRAGQALVRVSDIAYRLQVHADQLGVTLFHGTMQIDGFFAPYQWNGNQPAVQRPRKGHALRGEARHAALRHTVARRAAQARCAAASSSRV